MITSVSGLRGTILPGTSNVVETHFCNRVKTLINKANRVLVQHSDDAEFCPGFQSCEYNIKFQQSHSDVST